MNILFIGDIVGQIGRKTIAKLLPTLKKEEQIDLVLANAENSAHGSGINEKIIQELGKAGIDYFSTGDHALQNSKKNSAYELENVLRPANFPSGARGQGFRLIKTKNKNILFINLIGRVFMRADFDCPFRKLDEILANTSLPQNNIFAIIVDIHAEATSEKIALMHYAKDRVSAIIGTHTHIMTADPQITDYSSAFISDVGMTGVANECLGVEKEGIIKTFLTQVKEPHIIPIKGQALLNAVIIKLNQKTGRAKSIKTINKFININ